MFSVTDTEKFVLVVCHANICRSPLIQFQLQQQLPIDGWSFVSRGTHVRDCTSMCAESAASVVAEPKGRDFVEAFRSMGLKKADTRAALVITASRRERSLISRMSPATRGRVFTMTEAAELASAVPERSLAGLGPAVVAAHLDAIRRSGMLPQAMAPESMDIPDPHLDPRTRHDSTVEEIQRCIERLVEAIHY